MPNRGTVSALVAISLVAFAASCNNNLTEVSNPSDNLVDQTPMGPMSESSIVTKDGQIYQNDKLIGSVKEVLCTPDTGCVKFSTSSSAYGQMQAALVNLDSGIKLDEDCSGDCGPIGITWCGDATSAGVPYNDRWLCLPQKINGVCTMKATAYPCDGGETCELSGSYPSYGQCPTCLENVDCDDGNVCTTDSCNAASGQCTNAANSLSCDDGNKCNGIEACQAKVCKAGNPLVCADNNACTDDTCLPASGCSFPAKSGACDDGNVCTLGDTCVGNVCQSGSNADCNDNNPCTADSCGLTGCVHPSAADSTVCNDNNACTTQENCQTGVCVAGVTNTCNDANPCTVDSCNPATGACTNAAGPDGLVCGETKVCVVGLCALSVNTCSTKDLISCRQVSGVLGSYRCVFKPGATLGTWDALEICGPVSSTVCLDGAGCQAGNPSEASCKDGLDNDGDNKIDCLDADCALDNACTGKCTANAQCDDANPCTTDTCTVSTGACSNPPVTCATSGHTCNPTTGICAAPPACVPACTDKQCGADGCGGTCGTCTAGLACDTAGKCSSNVPPPGLAVQCPQDTAVTFWGDIAVNGTTPHQEGTASANQIKAAPVGFDKALTVSPSAGCTCFDKGASTGPTKNLSGGGHGCQT